ncbi:MAG TPA: hypothetical protein VED86_02335 [archaeon]|nr:hypothetical protein [archaeon]
MRVPLTRLIMSQILVRTGVQSLRRTVGGPYQLEVMLSGPELVDYA